MNVAGISRKTASRFRTTDGKSFLGTLFTPTPRQNSGFDAPHMMMRVAANSNAAPGMVFKITGRVYMLADHMAYQTPSFGGRAFTLIEMSQFVQWTRVVTAPDTVTGMARPTSAAPTDLGMVWTSYESAQPVMDMLSVPKPKYTLATNAALVLGDFLAGRKVVEVYQQLGVTHAVVL